MLNSANMYPWYRDSMSQLGQFCSAGTNLPAPTAAHIKTENGYNDCMLALDYAQNKVSRTLSDFYLSLLRRSPLNAVSISASFYLVIYQRQLLLKQKQRADTTIVSCVKSSC